MRIEGARAPERAKAPDVSEQLLLLEDALRIPGERDEELVLLDGELHRLPADRDRARSEVDLEVAHGEPGMLWSVRPAEDSTHPREQFVVDEGLAVRGFVCCPRRLFRADRGDAGGRVASDPLDPE
jgi:hypothetical protein